ncbi:ABC transporter permease [Hymenobacter sp. NST-14]|uniref:ABC transporter permease n=1 Tax=Hymenobacter piscis TaxID=2839984 RepID=UPI001C013423|nr:ABC transporter permease [Hymenobacter piscis]MBT9391858.1 ABC transporter permease [Hymenobacter piscis]
MRQLCFPRSFSLRQLLAAGWLLLVVGAATWAPSAALAPDLAHISQPPGGTEHWLGTDPQGLDVWGALLQGARTLVLVSVPASLLTLLLGTILGSAAGFLRNSGWQVSWRSLSTLLLTALAALVLGPRLVPASAWLPGVAAGSWILLGRLRLGRRRVAVPLDALVLGLMSLLESVPLLILVLAAAAVQRPSLGGLVVLLSLTCWTTPARLMRAATLQVSAQPYLEAARAAGIPTGRLLVRHIWPNTRHVLLVRFPLTIALLIGLETTLSFLGVGLPPEVSSWGQLLAAVRFAPTAWWLVLWPGIMLVSTILSLHIMAQNQANDVTPTAGILSKINETIID